MISPLPGISTVVHTFVVVIGGTVNSVKKGYKKLQGLKEKKNRAKTLSVVIILLVCLFIFVGAYSIVHMGLESNKSNLNIIERLFNKNYATAGLPETMTR